MADRSIGIGQWNGSPGQSRLALSLLFTGNFGTQPILPDNLVNAYTPQNQQILNLASGFNAVSVPTQAGGVIIVMPTGNTQTVTLKGVTADTGIALSKIGITVLTFDNPPPASIGLTCGGAINGVAFYFF